MRTPQKHITTTADDTYYHLEFESIASFHAFTASEIESLERENKRKLESVYRDTQEEIDIRSEWFGVPSPKSIGELETYFRFRGIKLAHVLRPKVEEKLAKFLSMTSNRDIPQKKLRYNDKGIGVYSFDKASTGLQPIIRVDTPLHQVHTQLQVATNSLSYYSNINNCYLRFQPKHRTQSSVQLYVVTGVNAGVDASKLLYKGLACSELVRFLEKRKVPVQVNVLIGSKSNRKVFLSSIQLKSYEERFDLNSFLVLSSDPKYFRFRGFKHLISLYNYFGERIPNSLGKLPADLGTSFLSATKTEGFLFENSDSIDSAVEEVQRIITAYYTP